MGFIFILTFSFSVFRYVASRSRSGRGSSHVQTPEEDSKLIEALLELKIRGTFNGENSNRFKKGNKKEIEKSHIECRCNLVNKQYYAIYGVQNNGERSDFA